jgi:uncharacterized heparinase superfamily protein
MSLTAKRQRLADLTAEVRRLEDFIAAVDRGEHDDEAAIAAAAETSLMPVPGFTAKKKTEVRRQRIREMRRNTLKIQALDRMNNEIYPEIQQLQFELGLG